MVKKVMTMIYVKIIRIFLKIRIKFEIAKTLYLKFNKHLLTIV